MDGSHALLLVNTVICYVAARFIAKKDDVEERKPFEHIEAVMLLLALIALVLFVFPQDLGLLPQLMLPITVAVYGLFMSRVSWVTSDAGKITSIVMFAVVAASVWGYTMYQSQEGQVIALATLVAVGTALIDALKRSLDSQDQATAGTVAAVTSLVSEIAGGVRAARKAVA
jgi:hypothetical protein